MTSPISSKTLARAADRAPRASSAPTTTATTPPTTFTRNPGPAKPEQVSTFGRKEQPAAAPMTGTRTLGDAQLKSMGAEILQLYSQKVLANGGRRLDFTVEGAGYSVRGADIGAVLIHSKQGLVQLHPDGTPMRNRSVPIESWAHLESGLARVLEKLRSTEPSARGPANAKV